MRVAYEGKDAQNQVAGVCSAFYVAQWWLMGSEHQLAAEGWRFTIATFCNNSVPIYPLLQTQEIKVSCMKIQKMGAKVP